MKVKLLPLAIGAAIAMPGVALADGPTVYGKMNVSYDFVDIDTGANSDDNWELNSNASRLGVKGSEEINANLSAIYKAEYEIAVDDGDDVFKQRDIYAGLTGGWGTFKAGNFDSPLKKAQGKIDQFNDMQFGDIKNFLEGENRESNLLQYSSPKIADALVLNLAIQPGEENEVTTGCTDCDNGAADNFSASVVYDSDMAFAALAFDDGIDGWDTIRLAIQGKLAGVDIGFLYQTAEATDDVATASLGGDLGLNTASAEEQEGYVLSAGLKLGEMNKLRAQYGFSETDFVNPDNSTGTVEITQYAFGYDHKLSKQTKLFANYIMVEDDDDAEASTLQVGMEHKF